MIVIKGELIELACQMFYFLQNLTINNFKSPMTLTTSNKKPQSMKKSYLHINNEFHRKLNYVLADLHVFQI